MHFIFFPANTHTVSILKTKPFYILHRFFCIWIIFKNHVSKFLNIKWNVLPRHSTYLVWSSVWLWLFLLSVCSYLLLLLSFCSLHSMMIVSPTNCHSNALRFFVVRQRLWNATGMPFINTVSFVQYFLFWFRVTSG